MSKALDSKNLALFLDLVLLGAFVFTFGWALGLLIGICPFSLIRLYREYKKAKVIRDES